MYIVIVFWILLNAPRFATLPSPLALFFCYPALAPSLADFARQNATCSEWCIQFCSYLRGTKLTMWTDHKWRWQDKSLQNTDACVVCVSPGDQWSGSRLDDQFIRATKSRTLTIINFFNYQLIPTYSSPTVDPSGKIGSHSSTMTFQTRSRRTVRTRWTETTNFMKSKQSFPWLEGHRRTLPRGIREITWD